LDIPSKSSSPIPLTKGGWVSGISVLTLGTAIAHGIGLLAVPLLTRIYSVQDFGQFQLFFSILSFAVVLSTLRYELAVPLPEDPEVAFHLVAVGLFTAAVMSLSAFVLARLACFAGLVPIHLAPLVPYTGVMAISMFGAGASQVLTYWTTREKTYSSSALAKITQTTTQSGAQLAWGYFIKAGSMGLILGDALGRMAAALALGIPCFHRAGHYRRGLSFRLMWQAALRYRTFPLVSTCSAMINAAGLALPMLFVEKTYGTFTLGWLAAAERLVGLPAQLISLSLSQVYLGEAARLAAADPPALRQLFMSLLRRLLLIGIVPCIFLMVVAPRLFAFVLGEPWREAGVYGRYVAVLYYVVFVTWPLMPTLNALEKQAWQFLWDVGRLLLVMASLWAASRWGCSARCAVAVYSTSLILGYAVHLFLSHCAIKRRITAFRSGGNV
jgi:O-antigen/teichoic acid export membrane protein